MGRALRRGDHKDHTRGLCGPSPRHLNGEQFRAEVARLREPALLENDARIYATHIAHHSNPVHQVLVEDAATHGYLVAHDGLTIEL